MPTYLVRETYTHEAWKFLVEHPDQEAGAMQPTEEFERMVAANGWTLLGRWWSFDDHQAGAVFLIDLPDRLDVASFAILAHARGHVTGFEATPLLSYEEARQALHAAARTPVSPSVLAPAERLGRTRPVPTPVPRAPLAAAPRGGGGS